MKKCFMILISVLIILTMVACGSSPDTAVQDVSQGTGEVQAEAVSVGDEGDQAVQEDAQESETEVHPYAWLGLQDIPACNYLDNLAARHYIKKSDVYIAGMSYVSEETNAVDGINTYKKNENSLVYSIDGKAYSINEDNKSYMEMDMADIADSAEESSISAMENGTNIYGRNLVGTGSEVIPIYSDETGDKDEYEYYEYNYPEAEEATDTSETERFYLKDGDVFAIYTKITMGDTVIESTEVIKEMSGDIPEGTFDVPDLSGYEKIEF